MKKLISISIYGDAPMYLQGAIENAKLRSSIYPDWDMIIYCENKTDPTVIEQLQDLGCRVEKMGRNRVHSGMLWRFLPGWNPRNTYVIFRDSDSRFNPREAAAVEEWLSLGHGAHCMHDHPHHASLPLFGGMWGVRGGILQGQCPFKKQFGQRVPRVGDMRLLQKHVLPIISKSLLRHSSVDATRWGECLPFPEHEPWDGFVGQQYNEHGVSISV